MNLLLLILVPLLTGALTFAVKGNGARILALISTLVTLALSVVLTATCGGSSGAYFSMPWVPDLGTAFSLLGDGMSIMLCLLTAIVMLVVMLANSNKEVVRPNAFYGFLLLA